MQNKFNAAIHVYGEMKKSKGEDSYSNYITDTIGYMGIFDGCGGIGAKRYPEAFGATGAYLASRMSALQVYKWFEQKKDDPAYVWGQGARDVQELLYESLKGLSDMLGANATELKGSLTAKELPTTAAMCFYHCQEEAARFKFMWAGDSRGYILNGSGLSQITKDDVDDGEDAYSNLSNDARLLNVVNAQQPFKIHQKSFKLKNPCIVLVASDGVFGYVPTPMEFENMLLTTLVKAESFNDWETLLREEVVKYASDDYSVCAAVFGFRSFEQCRDYFSKRANRLNEAYIKPIHELREHSENPDLSAYWDTYKEQYEKYLK